MKRFLNPALVAIAAVAMFGLAACGSTATPADTAADTGAGGGGQDATVADGTDGDTAAKSETAAGGDAAADAMADDAKAGETTPGADAKPDVPAPCGGACTSSQTCDTKTNKCVDKPCGGACKAGEKCGADNKCFLPCGGPCKAGETCDTATDPKGKCVGFVLPTKWGVGDDGKVQKVVKLAISDKKNSCDLVDAAGALGKTDGTGDNALAGASSLIGSNLQDAVKKGQVVLLFEPKTYKTDGTAFTFNVLIGDVDPSDAAHDATMAGGKYTVKPESYDLTKCTASSCPALVSFNKAAIKSGKLTASADKFFLNLNISSIALALTISAVQFSGDVTDANSWVDTKAGRLCGYITETDLNSAIDALPPDMLAQFGGVDAVKKLIPTLIKSDVDSDGDGVKDAKSLSLDIDTLGGIVTGVTPPKAP